ncbi:hypothetical protein [Enterovibrio calviensis]|uniref:hypothetical protein n=1 Tax=Enterovibrio calviensis TaxID=91359 RepID=UPI00068436A0|nr:hypothetical protein [Enterovibrio calviensis]
MLRQIKPSTTPSTRAQWALTLVWWVVFVCLSQNAGLFNVCGINSPVLSIDGASSTQSTSQASNLTSQPMTNQANPTSAGHCELSENLVQLSSSTWESATFTMWVLAFAILAWLLSTSTFVPKTIEPIPPPRRLHLTFCVFKE